MHWFILVILYLLTPQLSKNYNHCKRLKLSPVWCVTLVQFVVCINANITDGCFPQELYAHKMWQLAIRLPVSFQELVPQLVNSKTYFQSSTVDYYLSFYCTFSKNYISPSCLSVELLQLSSYRSAVYVNRLQNFVL